MTTKDYVYLGLIAFSALVFYLHGYYAGATVGRRKLNTLNSVPPTRRSISSASTYVEPAIHAEAVEGDTVTLGRSRMGQTSERLQLVDSVHCFFGNN